MGHHFLLLSSDEFSYRLMECDDKTFPFSNFTRLHKILTSKQNEIKSYFITAKNYDGNGILDQEGLAKCFKTLGIELNAQELITIWRKMDKKGKDKVPFSKLIKLCQEDALLPS